MRTHCLIQRSLFVLALLAPAAAIAQPPASPASRGVVLHVELAARTLSPGTPLLAGVQMRNVSDHDVEIFDDVMAKNSFQGFKVEVTTLDGQPVAVTRWGAAAMGRAIRLASVSLLPGEEQMAVLDIGRAFDLTKPGDYVLRVMRAGARSVPVVFSLVEGVQPDARKAAVSDPQRHAAEAEYAGLTANAPLQVSGPARSIVARLDQPLNLDLTLTNRSAKPVRFGYRNWVRLEVEYPDGRTIEVFGRNGDRDWNQFLGFSTIAAHQSVVFKTLVQDRFQFTEPGNYVLRFWFPRAADAYTLPVTVTATSARR
jgi:hypothetical protein